MFLIRPVALSDLDALEEFAHATSLGITNLPKNRTLLEEKIEHSLNSFAKRVDAPYNELYLFVLESVETQTLGGTCAIFSKTGVTEPSYFYSVEQEQQTILHPRTRKNGPSETCGLYLKPEFRKEGLGKLLSLSRFLYIAEARQRFDETVITELRGVIRKNGTSPLWDGLGRFFSPHSFTEALTKFEKDPHFLASILPKYPIYADLLALKARLVLGKTHPSTRPALKMLQKEGFSLSSEVDIMDGGPHLAAQTDNIRTVRESRRIEIKSINNCTSNKTLISTCEGSFRVCIGSCRRGVIDTQTAKILDLKVGDSVRIATMQPRRKKGS